MTDPSELERGPIELAPAGALASVEVDVSSLTPGNSLVVQWRGKPVVVHNRTRQEMKDGEAVDLAALKDTIARDANLPADAPATDANRTAPGKEAWLVMVQVCTHLGCIPIGQDGDSAAGSARATALDTTAQEASAKVRRRRTWRFRCSGSFPIPRSVSVDARTFR